MEEIRCSTDYYKAYDLRDDGEFARPKIHGFDVVPSAFSGSETIVTLDGTDNVHQLWRSEMPWAVRLPREYGLHGLTGESIDGARWVTLMAKTNEGPKPVEMVVKGCRASHLNHINRLIRTGVFPAKATAEFLEGRGGMELPVTLSVAPQVEAALAQALVDSALSDLRTLQVRTSFPDESCSGWDSMIGAEKIKAEFSLELEAAFGDTRKRMDGLTQLTRGQRTDNFSDLVMLSGPPGVGKTKLARLGACKMRVPFIEIKAHNFKDKYVGETERRIDFLFNAVDSLAEGLKRQSMLSGGNDTDGVLMFLDEIDSVISNRSRDSESNSGSSILSGFLTRLGGNQSAGRRVLACASNQASSLDEAFKSRIGWQIQFTAPEFGDLFQLFKANARHLETTELETLARDAVGLVPRDVLHIIARAEREWAAASDAVGGPSLSVYLKALSTRQHIFT